MINVLIIIIMPRFVNEKDDAIWLIVNPLILYKILNSNFLLNNHLLHKWFPKMKALKKPFKAKT
jgi:hypothetical protein